MTRGRTPRRPGSPAQEAYWRSAAFRERSRRQTALNNLELRARPRCGAARRSDGQPCCKPAKKASGRCHLHGGATPRGKRWHTVVWPDGSAPDAELKLARKLKSLERRQRARKRRLAAMTPEERAAHEAWQRAHQPGDPKRRAGERERRRRDVEAAKLLAQERPADPKSPELLRVEEALAEIERRRQELEAQPPEEGAYEGVFS